VAQGRENLEDEHASRPRTIRTEIRIQKVAMLLCANRSQMVDEVTAAGISHGICHKLLSDDLNMSWVTQHSVPRVLTQDQYDNNMSTCSDLIDSVDKDGTFCNQIITGEKTCCFST
jgi:hypothetical protein